MGDLGKLIVANKSNKSNKSPNLVTLLTLHLPLNLMGLEITKGGTHMDKKEAGEIHFIDLKVMHTMGLNCGYR